MAQEHHRRASAGRADAQPWTRAGAAFSAPTLGELARLIGVPPDALRDTAARYNNLVDLGVDQDFHRGESAYDRYYGDPSYPNRNLAHVELAPFYAFAIRPGDLGTKGGLVTDRDARVLRGDGARSPACMQRATSRPR